MRLSLIVEEDIMAKRKTPRSKNRKVRSAAAAFQTPVPAVTKEELHFAMMVGAAAANNLTPRQSFESKFRESAQRGELDPSKSYLTMTDIPLNHAAFAIMDAFPEKTESGEEKRQALLWRAIFAYAAVARDRRFAEYTHEKDGQFFIEEAIVEALAATPMSAGAEVPVDAIFSLAAELIRTEKAA
jgi:hypothetical protein